MINPELIENQKKFLEWMRERVWESSPGQRNKEIYASQCRAFDNGIQHIENAGVTERGLQKFVHENFTTAAGDNPVRITMNMITRHRIRNAAKTNPQRFEAVAIQPVGVSSPNDAASRTIWQAMANSVIDDTALVKQASIANEERCVDGLHGFGVRINRRELPSGQQDAMLEAFEFDGYRLSLDPTKKSTDLTDHEWVIYSEVMTKTQATRVFGSKVMAGIKDEDLRTVGSLLPVEMAFNRLSGGTLYSDFAQHSKSLGLVVRTVWLKGPLKRFDRMYLVLDTRSNSTSAGDVVVNFDNPANPYGGDGMPLGLLRGFRRPGSPMPISDVGMMVDDQRKANLAATVWFNAYWDYVQKVYLVDRNWIYNGHSMSANQILDMIETGILVGGGNPTATPPALMNPPQPPQIIGDDLERWVGHLREGVFSSDQHIGKTKSHVPATASQLAFSSAEAPLLDREQADISEYTRVIRTATATAAGLVKTGAPYMINMLHKAGMSAEQIGYVIQSIDPASPCEMRLTQRALRRQTRSEQKDEVLKLVDRGAYDPLQLPSFYTQIDLPLSERDRQTSEWVELEVANIVNGEVYDPVPLGQRATFMLDALQSAMMQTSGQDPAIRGRLIEAYQAQIEIDGLDQQDEQAQEEPAQPEETTLQDLVG